ncbi:hypothetical protein NPIL_605081 [Nephila pilipes]|uniref:Uncharacterized protein n=1 Tax=Nephila pilipes TaxID=299642 RepID=A0A8X6TKT3_NEPPI|nr:hypothetical protein NPIL_605081 [Nephila pilipes]
MSSDFLPTFLGSGWPSRRIRYWDVGYRGESVLLLEWQIRKRSHRVLSPSGCNFSQSESSHASHRDLSRFGSRPEEEQRGISVIIKLFIVSPLVVGDRLIAGDLRLLVAGCPPY